MTLPRELRPKPWRIHISHSENDLEILPVINKIDLPNADPDRVVKEIEDIIGIPAEDAPRISAKTGLNVSDVLEKIVDNIPAPAENDTKPLRALIFDSVYDSYRGVIVYVRVFDGKVSAGDRILMMATGAEFDVVEVGYLRPFGYQPSETISCRGSRLYNGEYKDGQGY